MAERNLPSALKSSLLANDPYSYFHLIKFERPNGVASSNFVAGKATDYAYITDSSINIDFDDGSKSSKGVANGSQTYVANKVLKVGTVNETTEAKASNMNLVLSGTALGTIVTTSAAFASSSMTTTIDLLEAGFQEGDILLLESAGNTNNNKYARIDKFTNANKTVALTGIDCTIDNAVSQTYNLSYASEEISALLNNKEATNYTNYVNREVFIYRGHFEPETGTIIGEPFVIFKGIISKGSVQEDVLKDSKVSWNLTSHWGDFVRVQGRLTSDYSHRALSITGGSDVGALVRPEYQYDLGFAHAERAVNLIATYQTQETRYKMKKRGGFAGFIGLKKTVEYQVEVDREVDLQFNLTARSLPVVYGVQKVDSIPVFADILESNAKEVYVAHAFAEGEIGGIFDVHIEDTSSVCLDQNDKNNRTASDGVNIACYGRADQGFVLAGETGRTNTEVPFALANTDLSVKNQDTNQGGYESVYRNPTSGPSRNIDNSRTGLQHETTFSLHHAPTPTTIFVHTGKADQDADDTLVKKASNSDFKLQNQLSDIDPNNYWSPNHKLLDTAYVVAKYVIGEGETTISKLEFVVSGKKVRSYNYDHSYDQDSAEASAGQEFFNIGDVVTIHRTNAEGSNAADSQIGSSAVTIIDKWSFYRDSTTLLYRFRLSANPQADINSTAFYIKRTVDGVEKKWHMVSHDHKVEATTLTASTPMTATVTNIPAYSSSGGNHAKRVITLSNLTNLLFYGLCQPGHFVSFNFSGETPTAAFRILSVDTTNKKITVVDNDTPSMRQVRNAFNNLSGSETCTLRNHNLVNLSSSGSTTNDAYNNRSITFTRFDSEGNITHEEEREIVDYAVNTPTNTYIAIVSRPLPFEFSPGTVSDDSYTIQAGQAEQDIRVSINPAIQLLDYLKNKRYGKGLDDKDINLPTFLQAARDCDTRSDVTLQIPTNLASSIVVGDVYKYPVGAHATNPTKWQGTVKSATHRIVNIVGSDGTTITPTDFTEIVFTNIIGKFGRKWNNWETFEANELFWHLGKVYYKPSSGVQTAVPTTASVSFYNSNLTISKVSGTGPSTLAISITDGFTSSGNPIVKSFTSAAEGFNSPGYSLYDSDDVKYWKYLGWDEQSQRFVTRHQTNQIIDTSVPLFDNINSMLKQFNGILRYSGGKYELAIKSASPSSFETFQTINDTDIIGKIKLQDKGQKGIFNSMSANVVDPQNNYNARSITYFNSDYLKEDKGIRRSGQFAMPGISNYFNSRINIKQFLDESRYGLDIAFTLDSKAYLLLTGEIIRITNERFGWSNKLFRIDNLNFQANGLVQVTATEHNDAAYLIGAIKTPFSMKDSEDAGAGSVAQTPISTPAGLTGLTATSGAKGAIDLAWTNSTSFNTATHTTEVWASSTNDRTNATLIYTTQSAKMSDIVAEQTLVTKFYWVRHTVVTENGLVVPSAYFPTSSTAGVQGTATGAIDGSDGSDGARGAGRWHIQVSSLPTTSALANTRWGDGSGSQPSAAVVGDQAFFYTGTLSSPTAQKVWIYAGSSNWTEQVEVIDGDLLVQGTITADRMVTNTLTANEIAANTLTANEIAANAITASEIAANAITSDAIAANAITASKITTDAITASKIAADAVTAGKIAADAVTATEIDVSNLAALNANLGAVTAGTLKGGSIPDANAAPSGSEAGAFMDLTGGKMVFGKASKHILFDGTDLILSGVTIDANSIVNSTAGVIVQEDGSSEATTATTLNFTTGLNVAVTGSAPTQTATISLDSGFATQSFVTTAIDNLIDGAPGTLNTLNEIAEAIADNDNFSGAMTTSLAGKLSLTGGALTGAVTTNSTFDGRNVSVDGAKLDGISPSANNYSHPNHSGDVTSSGDGATTIASNAVTFAKMQDIATDTFMGRTASGTGDAKALSVSEARTMLNIENGATADQTASEILTLLKTVDSNTSGLNAATLDGQEGAHYLNYTNFTNKPTTITTSQANAITANTAKVGITTSQANAITANTAKVGISTNNVTNASVSGNTLTLNRQGASNVSFTGREYTAGDGLSLSSDEFTVDSTVVRTSGNQTIGGVKTFSGNATFNGTLQTADNKILINSDLTGTPASSVTAGIEIERGNQSNKSFVYAENGVGPSNNLAGWTFGSESVEAGTFFGTFVGDITGTPSSLAGLTTDNLGEGSSNLYFTNARAVAAITAGNGISKTGSTLDLDLSELTDMTATMSGTDEFIVMDNSAERRKAANEIDLSIFSNSTSGFVTSSGVTSVSGTAPVVSSGGNTPAISVTTAAVANNGTSLATGDQIYDHVTTRISGLTGNTGTVTSVAISHGGNAFNTGSAITTSGTLAITMAGSSSQYVNGAGNLANFPSIPSAANNGTITINQAGVQKGQFTVDQSGNTIINLTDNNTDTNTNQLTVFQVENSSNVDQFSIGHGDGLEFVGSGATSVSFDSSNKRVTISSTDTNTNTNTQNQYAISCADGDNTDEEKIVLSGSGHNGNTTDNVVLEAGTGLTIARSGDKITFTNSNPTDSGNSGGTVTSVGITHGGNAFTAGSAVTTSGNLAITMAGSSSEYITGEGNLVAFPTIPTNNNQLTNGSSFISSIAQDTSPQLGGNLDVQTSEINTSTSNRSINLNPHGSGTVVFKGNSTRGAGQFKLNCENNSHGITIKGPPHSAAASYTLTLPNNDGNANQVLKTDGSGVTSWVDQASGGVSSISAVGNSGISVTDGATSTPEIGTTGNLNTIATASTIPSLSVDFLEAGTINANHIAADTIVASHIDADAVTADAIDANAVTAEQLQISNNSSGSAGIFMDYNSGNPRIDIRDSSALRVRIGYLG